MLREQIVGMLENYRVDIGHRIFLKKILDRMPPWLKWVITVIILAILLGVFSNYLYDLLRARIAARRRHSR